MDDPSGVHGSTVSEPTEPRACIAGKVAWIGSLANISGYSEEARHFVWALDRMGVPVVARNASIVQPAFVAQLFSDQPEMAMAVNRALLRSYRDVSVTVAHCTGAEYARFDDGGVNVVRTMFETDSLPAGWAENLNDAEEVWVPTSFNEETFRRAGVEIPIEVVPGGVDVDCFRPGLPPYEVPGSHGTIFLAVFEWSHRKGPDVLLRAWAEAFDPSDDVTLLLRIFPRGGHNFTSVTTCDGLVDGELCAVGRSRSDVATICIVAEHLAPSQFRRLMATADCYVCPSRGEGFGYPLVQSLASGVSVIATNWGAHLEFLDASYALMIEDEGLEEVDARMDLGIYHGHRWASPSVGNLAELLRWAHEHPESLRAMGAKGRRAMEESWTWDHAAQRVRDRLDSLMPRARSHRARGASPPGARSHQVDPDRPRRRYLLEQFGPPRNFAEVLRGAIGRQPERRAGTTAASDTSNEPMTAVPSPLASRTGHRSVGPLKLDGTIGVRWVGNLLKLDSLAKANRELCRLLARDGRFSIYPVGSEDPDQFPEALARLGIGSAEFHRGGGADVEVRHRWPPELSAGSGAPVAFMQPWEFGTIPEAWVTPLTDNVDEVWAPTRFVRNCYLAGGIPEDRVHLVPFGVDTELFRPEGATWPLAVEDVFRFLYVGGTIFRKGIDIAVEVYLSTFSRHDDTCLVVKPHLSDSLYRGYDYDETLRSVASDRNLARVEIVDAKLSDEEMAQLYRSCAVLVAPFRGEGFGLPVAEAMACGLPVIVTAGGACDDFVDDAVGWSIPSYAREIAFPGIHPASGSFSLLDPDRPILGALMRHAFVAGSEVYARGSAARSRAVQSLGWEHGYRSAADRLVKLASLSSR